MRSIKKSRDRRREGIKLSGYNKRPKLIGEFPIDVQEMFSYTYLPIKLRGVSIVTVERRLHVFDSLVGRACCDFIGEFGLDRYIDSYVYLTAKNQYQRLDNGFNRPGWHSDGFMTDDISYIWSNKQPTIFNDSNFVLTQDDQLSMEEMDAQSKLSNCFTLPNFSLIRMDQFSIHRVGVIEKGVRAFVKICFSRDKYNLIGNSINYDLDYNWAMKERNETRNIPQSETSNVG
jgi:hypothetical protein